MRNLEELHDRAARRHGLVTVADLRAAGFDKHATARLVQGRRLQQAGPRVYRFSGAPMTFESMLLATVLSYGDDAYVSYASAAWLWDLPGIGRPGLVEVTRGRHAANRPRAGVRVHRSRTLPADHRTVHRLIPVTTMARTIFDMATQVGPNMLDAMVEEALRTSFCSVGSLHRVLEDMSAQGRTGVSALRRSLEGRGRDYVPTESELDVLGRRALDGIGGLEWQVEISDEQGYIRRVDGLHRESGLVIEWDGAEFHDRARQRKLDAAQDRRLNGLGLIVLRFRWHDVTGDPAGVRADVLQHVRAGREAV